MTRIQTGSSSARHRQAITSKVQVAELRQRLRTARKLTVVEVANLTPPIPGIPPGDVNKAMSVTSEYGYTYEETIWKNPIPGGKVRVVYYDAAVARADRSARA